MLVVELVDFEPAAGRRKIPAKPVDEDAFAVVMHLHQRIREREPVFREDQIDHLRMMTDAALRRSPGNYRVAPLSPPHLSEAQQKLDHAMTAITPIQAPARRKPDRRRPHFPRVGMHQLHTIPGKKGLPLLGILPEAVRDPHRFALRMYETFGPVHRFYACGNWNVQLVGPEANEFVLFDREGTFSAYGGWKPVFGRYFDGGLLLRDGADHQWHRKLIAAAFKQDQLQRYLDVFSHNAASACSRWSGLTLDLYEFAQRLAFANGYSAFLGLDAAQATRNDLLAFRYLMRSVTAVVPVPFPGNAHWRAAWARRHIRRTLEPLMAAPPDEERSDLAAALLRMKEEGQLSGQEIAAHLTFTIAASFDALSSGTVSTLYYLARHREWQERVREELCANIACADAIALGDLQKCEVSEWAVKEALRLNAAAPVLWRRALCDTHFAGHSIPSGTLVGVNPMLTHLLPHIWEDPTVYNPARFSAEGSRRRNRFAFVPFGAGAHSCLGANFAYVQIRALLRQLLEHHELVLATENPPRWYHWPNCRPKDPLPVELRRSS
jgi:cytochrome P450